MDRSGNPTPSTEKTLIAIARGRCEFRDCTNDIVANQKFLGEIAHIAAVAPGGPRYDKHLSTEQIRKIDNLLLLCPNHHNIIDNSPEIFSTESLQKIKKEHEEKYFGSSCKITEPEINRIVWERKFARFSQGTISSIPKTIKGNIIARNSQVSALSTQIKQSSKIIVVGDKGYGKSVVLAQLSQHLIDKSKNVLFIKCDDYVGIENLDELQKILDNDKNILDIIDEVYDESNPLIVICDSLDAVSRNDKSMNLFKNFLKLLWGTNKVKTICSVRRYDYEYSYNINQTDWGEKYDLPLLTLQELDKTLMELGNPSISDDLKKILANPLHLKLLSLILERSPNTDFTNIKNEIELYDEHWNEYVEKLELPSKVRSTLYDITQKMSSLQRITIPYDEFSNTPAMQQILSRNIVLRDEFSNMISFFHHAYLDYVISRFILVKHSEFVDYLQEDEHNVFLRPTIVFALSILNKRDPKSATSVIEKMLNSELKGYWKISALTALAKIKENNNQEFTSLGNFLTENTVLQRHFLMEITKHKNVFWFELWKDSFFVEWSSIDKGNSWFVMNYLELMVAFSHQHQHIFKLLQLLVTKCELNPVKREAVKISSKLDVKGKADWLLELSSHENSYVRNGVVKALPKLVETKPEIVPDVFCNLFTYVEESDEKTQLTTYGTLGLTSTRRQDNYMVIWSAGELFPELLKTNPTQMIRSTIKVFEVYRKKNLDRYERDVIEDYGHIWFEGSAFSDSRDENKLLNNIREYMKNDCTDEKMTELLPIFKSTRLATFHSILLDALIHRKNLFRDEIFHLISNPQVYEILTLRKNLRSAIKNVCPLLKKNQVEKLLGLVMDIKLVNRDLDEEGKKVLKRVKAEFLLEFPDGVLQTPHREILDKFSKPDLKYEPPFQCSVTMGEAPKDIIDKKPNPEGVITNSIDKELEHGQKIELLEAISEYLGKKREEIDKTKFQSIEAFLVKNKEDPDPQDNAEDKDGSFIKVYTTIRGLVARCLVQLLYHSNDEKLVPLVKTLANDSINTVRGEVCNYLDYLFEYNYDLAYSVTLQYSQDPDIRIQFHLRRILNLLVHKNPAHATLIVENMLNALDQKTIQGIEDYLVFLVFHKKEDSAINLLDKIINCQLFSPEIRSRIPYVLKEGYLFKAEFQDQSLDLLYRLLDDPDLKVREKAAFFTLNSFEDDDSVDNEEFVKKIRKHLERISLEVDKRPLEPRSIEHLVRFLEKFWHTLPEKTIDYLEKITGDNIQEYSAYQAVLAEESVKILTGLFQHPVLSKENRKRCLNILDKFTMAGWKEALQLLSAMERPD